MAKVLSTVLRGLGPSNGARLLGKKEQTAKRTKARRPVQREPKEVLAELVEKLRGKLELKATTSASQPEAGPRGVTRAREALVAARTELINATRGLVKSMGTRLPKCSSPSFGQKVKDAIPGRYGKPCCRWCN